MVDPIHPKGQPQSSKETEKTPPKPLEPVPDSTSKSVIPNFVKKMFPDATEKEQKQFWDNMQKSIADQIKRDQKFHEQQREERKQDPESGEF